MFLTQIFLASMFSTQKSVLHQCFQHKKLSFNAMFSMQKNEFCTNEQKIVFQPNVFNTIIVYMNIFNTNKISIASMFLTQYTKFTTKFTTSLPPKISLPPKTKGHKAPKSSSTHQCGQHKN